MKTKLTREMLVLKTTEELEELRKDANTIDEIFLLDQLLQQRKSEGKVAPAPPAIKAEEPLVADMVNHMLMKMDLYSLEGRLNDARNIANKIIDEQKLTSEQFASFKKLLSSLRHEEEKKGEEKRKTASIVDGLLSKANLSLSLRDFAEANALKNRVVTEHGDILTEKQYKELECIARKLNTEEDTEEKLQQMQKQNEELSEKVSQCEEALKDAKAENESMKADFENATRYKEMLAGFCVRLLEEDHEPFLAIARIFNAYIQNEKAKNKYYDENRLENKIAIVMNHFEEIAFPLWELLKNSNATQ